MSNASAVPGYKRFSDALAEPLLKAYRAGGFGLSLLTLGAILMLTAFFWDKPGPIRYIVLLTGAAVTFFVLAYVYFKEFPRVKKARASVVANKEMIDAIQQSAIELTGIASDLQSLAFKNADQISKVLTMARPLLKQIPLLAHAADSEAIVQAEGLSRVIVESKKGAEKIIVDLQQALIEANPTYLKTHIADLKRYRADINQMLMGR